MNYLAHLLLAEPRPHARIGALLGDFARGLDLAALPLDVRRSLLEHRAIDRFVDTHELVLAERQRFPDRLRRFSGILLDVFYDHFLVLHWRRFCEEPLGVFTHRVYAELGEHPELLSPRLAATFPHMARDDWLGSYGDEANVQRALEGMARRLRRPTPLAEGIQQLRERRPELEAHFLELFPAVVSFVARRRIEALGE